MVRMQTRIAAALTGGGLAIAGVAVASGGEADPLATMLEGIELTDEQQALADRLREDVQEDRQELQDAHGEMVQVFLTELERGEPDRGRLYAQVDEFVDLIGDAARNKLDGVLDLYAALDAVQQETFRQNIEAAAADMPGGAP